MRAVGQPVPTAARVSDLRLIQLFSSPAPHPGRTITAVNLLLIAPPHLPRLLFFPSFLSLLYCFSHIISSSPVPAALQYALLSLSLTHTHADTYTLLLLLMIIIISWPHIASYVLPSFCVSSSPLASPSHLLISVSVWCPPRLPLILFTSPSHPRFLSLILSHLSHPLSSPYSSHPLPVSLIRL